ncbi:electron transfer flavoprotein subunit alpha/FixB family protein [bacterium]|nr:electron transfer flavoprotein subunit alpha/FixB family protein [bacterium]
MSDDIHVFIEHLRGEVAEITLISLAAARVIAEQTGGEVVGVLLGHDVQGLAAGLAADRILSIDDPAAGDYSPDLYIATLAGLIDSQTPRAVLFGDTSMGAEIAGCLSGRLGLPLVGRCHTVRAADDQIRVVSQICGGKIFVESALPESTVVVSMVPGGHRPDDGRSETAAPIETIPAPAFGEPRVALKRYVEPEIGEIDITKEDVLVAIGRGIQLEENVELAEELAQALGGALCASRPIIDQGWLPSSQMVGKSGKRVEPKVYLALGVSGAPEHVEGMASSATVIAVNTDPAAPIFDVAHYGTEADLLDLLPELIDKVKAAGAG